MAEIKDYMDRGVQITTPDPYTLRISGPDGVLMFDEAGARALYAAVGDLKIDPRPAPPPVESEGGEH